MNTFLQKLKKINFKQPKYILPLMGYVLILFIVYMIIDIANTDVKKVKDDGLQTTEYINSTIPDARLKGDGVGSKYENMTRQIAAKHLLLDCITPLTKTQLDRAAYELSTIATTLPLLPPLTATCRNSGREKTPKEGTALLH